jgi:hypothetical protein
MAKVDPESVKIRYAADLRKRAAGTGTTSVELDCADEIFADWFRCTHCGCDKILAAFKYCPSCGRRIANPGGGA